MGGRNLGCVFVAEVDCVPTSAEHSHGSAHVHSIEEDSVLVTLPWNGESTVKLAMRKSPLKAGAAGAAAVRARKQVPTVARTLETFMAIANKLSVATSWRCKGAEEWTNDEKYHHLEESRERMWQNAPSSRSAGDAER